MRDKSFENYTMFTEKYCVWKQLSHDYAMHSYLIVDTPTKHWQTKQINKYQAQIIFVI